MCLWMKDMADANEVTRPTRHSFVIFLGRKWWPTLFTPSLKEKYCIDHHPRYFQFSGTLRGTWIYGIFIYKSNACPTFSYVVIKITVLLISCMYSLMQMRLGIMEIITSHEVGTVSQIPCVDVTSRKFRSPI